MIEGVTEEMHGSDWVPDLKTITSEPLGWDWQTSIRAKWRSSECSGFVRSKCTWHRRHCQRGDVTPTVVCRV